VDDPAGSRKASHLLSGGKLACGADVDPLLEQVADGHAGQLNAHQRDCVHCRAAIGEFTALWDPVRELAAAPVPAPKELTATVIRRIRRLVHDAGYTLQVTDDGAIRIAARIVAALARDSARLVPGVRVALGRSNHSTLGAFAGGGQLGQGPAGAAVGVLGRTAVVDLAVAVTYGMPLHDVARDIQRQVVAALRHGLDLHTVTVNVTVDDVLDDAAE
jgi:uncharacterized alkaline shock family protein YloU